MWFRALSFLIAAALLIKAAIALAIPSRFYAARRRQYRSEAKPRSLLVPPAIVLSVTAVAWYATFAHYRPWGWIVTGSLTLLAGLSLRNLTRWGERRVAMGRVVAHPQVWMVDVVLLLVGTAFAALGWFVYREPPTPDPRVVLWAWERPVDLRGLTGGIGVAFLAQTVTITDASYVTTPRRQPLRVDPATYLIAVTRVEAPAGVPERRETIAAIAATIAKTRALPRISAVQIDFDARASQRPMYRQLLHDVRAALPPGMPLSMTALASWCLDDNWLDDLPVDEAIPMLFRMGPAEASHRREFEARAAARACRGALGLSLDEAAGIRVPRSKRLYVFNPGPWTAETVRAAAEEIHQ